MTLLQIWGFGDSKQYQCPHGYRSYWIDELKNKCCPCNEEYESDVYNRKLAKAEKAVDESWEKNR